jgi:D-beta-D-heptose 7-phosphate kinase/D-beta-D-heptose 1-phosphate adenosyltransferase
MKKKMVVAISGGFDPVHVGHIRMFKAARKLGDELVVILNNDNWMMGKKGFVFMKEKERKEVLEAIRYVDRVIITRHKRDAKDRTVSQELARLKPDILVNGGDVKALPEQERTVCEKYGIREVHGVGGKTKIQASSVLVRNAAEKAK